MEPIAEVVTPAKRRTKEPRTTENGPNGKHSEAINAPQAEELALILASLQTMRDGDFTVRLPVAWVGLEGKIADTFNDIATANEQMADELKRVGQAVGKEGKTRERARFSIPADPGTKWSLGQLADRRFATPDHRGHTSHRRCGAGKPCPDGTLGCGRHGLSKASSCAPRTSSTR